ncbi:hypothetical protein GCM10020001_104640 [Nonomuraea salmonea]
MPTVSESTLSRLESGGRHPGGQADHFQGDRPCRARPQRREGYEWRQATVRARRPGVNPRQSGDAHVPHWLGNAGPTPVELLILFGAQGSAPGRARKAPEDGHAGAGEGRPVAHQTGHMNAVAADGSRQRETATEVRTTYAGTQHSKENSCRVTHP